MSGSKESEGWGQIKEDLDGVQRSWIHNLEEELRLLPSSHNHYDASKRRYIRRFRAELGMEKYHKDIEDEARDPGLCDKDPKIGRYILFPIGDGEFYRGGKGTQVIGQVRVRWIDKDGLTVFHVRGFLKKERSWSTFVRFEPLPYEMTYRVEPYRIIYVFPEDHEPKGES